MNKKGFLKNVSLPEMIQRLLIIVMLCWFAIFLIAPITIIFSKAFQDNGGTFVGLANFNKYFHTPALTIAIKNSIDVSLHTMVISVSLAFLFAYGMTRTSMKAKPLYRYIAMLPLFVPTMVHGLSLIYLFGKMGIVTKLGGSIELDGRTSIIIAEVIYTFPQAYMILSVALGHSDYRLYEASSTLGVSPLRTFFGVTLPSVKYGIISACAVCFTLCFTDFGAPQVVGQRFVVLSTSIYKQVIGQQNMTMGAVVGVILTIPAVVAFVIDRVSQRKAADDGISSKAVAYKITKNKPKDITYQSICTIISLAILTVFTAIIAAAVTTRWPYNMKLTAKHFDFGSKLIDGGSTMVSTSIKIALLTAVFGTIIAFSIAYLVQKSTSWGGARKLTHFMSMIPMALPGMVVGLAYIMFFNKPFFDISALGIRVSNSFTILYQTLTIIIIANIVHMFSVTYVTATTALKKLDKEYENVSDSMNVPFYKVFLHVTVPMSITAILEIAVYFFVNAMVTVSALVYLYTPKNRPAAIAILSMDDNGDYAAAAAMSVVILIVNIGARVVYEIALKTVVKRINRWKTGEIQKKSQKPTVLPSPVSQN